MKEDDDDDQEIITFANIHRVGLIALGVGVSLFFFFKIVFG
jgi:hypothetical protein